MLTAEVYGPDVDACGPDRKDDCSPSERRTLRMGDGCVPDEDSCQPSPGAGPVGVLDRPTTRTATACNPDQDGSDCSPAETPACEPSY
jgi:hypothetical protein